MVSQNSTVLTIKRKKEKRHEKEIDFGNSKDGCVGLHIGRPVLYG